MDDSIDLLPYLRAILKRWALVLGLALVVAIVATTVAVAVPRSSSATVDILIVPSSAQVALDPRFVNRDATLLTNATFQRQALIGLAISSALEERVVAQLPGTEAAALGSDALLARIAVSSTGDIIRITASADDEPAALALAEQWARSYERLVADVYSRDSVQATIITEQLDEAQKRYAAEQAALEAFYGQSRLFEVQREIVGLETLLNTSVNSANNLYLTYTVRLQELDIVLQDAQTLREQVADGSIDRLAVSLAALSLRSRAVGSVDLPVELRVEDVATLDGDAVTLTDLDTLIAVVTEQRDRIDAEARRVAAEIARGELPLTGLDSTARSSYERQLAALRREGEQLGSQEKQLIQRRDIALSSLEVLGRKSEEQQIAQATPQVAVRFVSARIDQPASVLMTAAIYGAVGLTFGTIVGVVVALALELIAARRRPIASASGGVGNSETSVSRPAVHR